MGNISFRLCFDSHTCIRKEMIELVRRRHSLDKVLEGISIRPLLSERCSMSYSGEVAQSKPILHTFIPACHFLLFGLMGSGGDALNLIC